MRKSKEQKNDNEGSVCTREYQLYRPGLFARWKHFPVAVEEVTVCVYH